MQFKKALWRPNLLYCCVCFLKCLLVWISTKIKSLFCCINHWHYHIDAHWNCKPDFFNENSQKSKISLCHRKSNHVSQLIFSGLNLISKTLKGNVKMVTKKNPTNQKTNNPQKTQKQKQKNQTRTKEKNKQTPQNPNIFCMFVHVVLGRTSW